MEAAFIIESSPGETYIIERWSQTTSKILRAIKGREVIAKEMNALITGYSTGIINPCPAFLRGRT
ncbi:MAG: hypothetical protein RMH74_08200 [Candidatus Caldarchaeum sp.]|nr:hypothetical protein [Candidatus Caldarchaeum sp.]